MKSLGREASSEFLGTFLLVALGIGSVAQAKLGGAELGSFLTINLSWGIAVALGICAAGHVSGAHLNPAVTLALAVHRKFPWSKLPAYVGAQVLGAFVAAELVYVCYYEALTAFDGGIRAVDGINGTAGIFATYPAAYLSTFPGGFVDQFIGTMLLMVCILAITDDRNAKWAKSVTPLLIGLVVVVIGMAFGANAGYAINPARDFGPRVFTALAGWGSEVFRAHQNWWWVPIVGPLFGAVAGGFAYDFFLPAAAEQKSALSTETNPAT